MNEISKKVEVVQYNPEWPKQFEIESQKIKDVLGENCLAVHHVGSTSVPGLAAKPKIDMIVVLNDTKRAVEKLESIGYQYRGEFNIPFHLGFSRRTEPQVNLHVYEDGNPEIELNLLFRDYLRTHPKDRDEYQKLKFDLLKEESAHAKNKSFFTGYTLGKNAFIKEILNKAGFHRLCLRFACHYEEWDKVKELRKKYFLDSLGSEDPYDWSVEHKNDLHFILYKGTDLVGYCHIECDLGSKAFLRIFVMDEIVKLEKGESEKIEQEFINLYSRWLKKEGFNLEPL